MSRKLYVVLGRVQRPGNYDMRVVPAILLEHSENEAIENHRRFIQKHSPGHRIEYFRVYPIQEYLIREAYDELAK